jgi:hypothetical protein
MCDILKFYKKKLWNDTDYLRKISELFIQIYDSFCYT